MLELGGNSGGLATAIVRKDGTCDYTIIDTHIPCSVGNELKKISNTDIAFIERNIFDLNLTAQVYDYIILMNLIHDYQPKEVIMQGLRLSVECKGGRQRTLEEMSSLLSTVGYRLEEEVTINRFHTMLTFEYA